ncbi:MAG: hypothetical protein KOO62_02745 [candidate division Zixibacteria bacterium]|nr:hypothetical protein [candidate division Zixibacteria bacterium]
MTHKSVLLLLVILCVAGRSTFCQSLPNPLLETDHPTAVSIDHIKALGIVTNGGRSCDSTTPIDVFADPDSTTKIGTIANHSFVRYDRRSELVGKPYSASRREYALLGGEKFRIYHNGITGWIGINNLMTFSSAWRERQTNRFFAVGGRTAACLYSSGQHETTVCVALTIWKHGSYDNLWWLEAVEYAPGPLSLYACPVIDALVEFDKDKIALQVSVRGEDMEDGWGSFAFYLYQDSLLVKSLVKDYNYRRDRDYTKLDCELVLDEAGEPVVLMIQQHFIVVIIDSNVSDTDYHSTLTATDTTVVKLLEQTEEQ